jgi:hypothetical protein
MSDKSVDFEKSWQDKLSQAVSGSVGENLRDEVMRELKKITQDSPIEEKIRCTCSALERLGEFTDDQTRRDILTQCACQYPVNDLGDIKAAYQTGGDIDQAISMLQKKFESFLSNTLELEEEYIGRILARGWGVAGIREGNKIISTKIPKSAFIREYFDEQDPEAKRRLYCHCPRVRDSIGDEHLHPEDYCYCGAGFYQGIWQEILGKSVKVEVLESVIQGGEVCRIAVHLPE